jgi:hypothetical protein
LYLGNTKKDHHHADDGLNSFPSYSILESSHSCSNWILFFCALVRFQFMAWPSLWNSFIHSLEVVDKSGLKKPSLSAEQSSSWRRGPQAEGVL